MTCNIKDLRPFIGAKDYDESRQFYQDLGCSEVIIDPKMSLFKINPRFSFYLQDYYVKDWVNNSMVFLEVENVEACERALLTKGLHEKYRYVRFSEIKTFDHGRELFMHDPSGVLWHFCQFNIST